MRPFGDDPIDFSPLDPTLDRARFEARVQGIAARAARQVGAGVEESLLRFGRPALAIAASMALAAWGPSLLAAHTASAGAEDPAGALLRWSLAGGPTSAAEVLESLGATR